MERFYHYIRPNEACRIPRRHIFLDSESRSRPVKGGQEQTFRCAVARFWAAEKDRKEQEWEREYVHAADLWNDIVQFTRGRSRTVLWAHNLGYDVRVVECLQILPLLGWTLVQHNFASRGTWMQWRKGQTSITMVDSASVFGIALGQLGEHFGIGKLDLPGPDADDAEWLARCRVDVDILATAIKAYLWWLESSDMGNWQHTGAGQSWAAFRHRFLTHQILVHADEGALAAERRAMWTGRCEAYWHGTDQRGIYHEWDLTLAYARVARDCPVPVRLLGPAPRSGDFRRWLDHSTVALLAECEVTTDVPVVPTRIDDRIAWPVGTFRTTLWGPEIKAAMDEGAQVSIVEGWLYRTAPALKAWGEWIVDALADVDRTMPAWLKVVLKHWARALVGRFAMTYTEWDKTAVAPSAATRRMEAYDAVTDREIEMLQIGTDIFEKSGTVEWRDSCPMITSYIISVARVRLWNIIRAAPDRAVLYVDTDSIICGDRHHDQIKAIADSPIGHGLRLKKSWRGISIWGPRAIVTGQLVRVSGLPRTARRTGKLTFSGQAWESLESSLRRGRAGRVMVMDRQWTIRRTDRRRVAGADGWTTPHRVEEGM